MEEVFIILQNGETAKDGVDLHRKQASTVPSTAMAPLV